MHVERHLIAVEGQETLSKQHKTFCLQGFHCFLDIPVPAGPKFATDRQR